MAMIVPPIDESAPIRREAQGLVGVFRAMARTAETINSSWKGLAALYSAPEEETVHSAMVKSDNICVYRQGACRDRLYCTV